MALEQVFLLVLAERVGLVSRLLRLRVLLALAQLGKSWINDGFGLALADAAVRLLFVDLAAVLTQLDVEYVVLEVA